MKKKKKAQAYGAGTAMYNYMTSRLDQGAP